MAGSSHKRFFVRHAKSSAFLVSLGIHGVLLFVALSVIVFRNIEKEDHSFVIQAGEASHMPLKKRTIPVHIRDRKLAAAANSKWMPINPGLNLPSVRPAELPVMKGWLGSPSSSEGLKGTGLGSEIDFFGIMGGGNHVVFIIDYSISMRGEKENIMRREVSRIIRELSRQAHFAVIFFAGPAWPADSGASVRLDEWVVTGSSAFSYRPKDWNGLPDVRYKKASRTTVSRVIREIERTPLAWGTVYDCPIYMALSMDPMPDTIYFMTDGECDEERGLVSLRKMVAQLEAAGKKAPVMHTVGFGINENEQLAAMAKLMGGHCRFLTPREYIQKYGSSRRRYKPNDSEVDRFESIETVTAEEYPVDFSLQGPNKEPVNISSTQASGTHSP